MEYKLFKNIYQKKVDNNFLGLYQPLFKHSFLFVPNNIAEELKKFDVPNEISEILRPYEKDLIKNRFLVPADYDELIPIRHISNAIAKEPKFGLMYLILTEECNLRCKYCFVEGNLETKPKFMDKETAEKAITLFEKNCENKKEPKVRIYGGEPLLNFEVFEYVIKNLRELEKEGRFENLEIAVATNGTLINEPIARFFKDYRLNASISLDGPEEIHNMSRRTTKNRGSYKEAVRGYNLLKAAGLSPAISCTITDKNADCLDTVVQFFLDELHATGMGFNHILDLKGRTNPANLPIEQSTFALLKAFEILRTKGIYEDRIMRRLGKIIENQIHIKDCAGYGHQIVVSPNGDYGPCHVFLSVNQYIAGNVYHLNGSLKNNSIFKEFNERNPFNMPQCYDCSFISICGGGCAFEPFNKKGTILEKDERACAQCKGLIDWVIDDLWKIKQNEIKGKL